MNGNESSRKRIVGSKPKMGILIACLVLSVFMQTMVAEVAAQPVVVDPAWTLIRTIEVNDPIAANYNPRDGYIYFGKRASGSDGLYRINDLGFQEKLASGSNVAAVAVQPDSGHVFFSEDYGGGIYRTAFGGTGRSTWVLCGGRLLRTIRCGGRCTRMPWGVPRRMGSFLRRCGRR